MNDDANLKMKLKSSLCWKESEIKQILFSKIQCFNRMRVTRKFDYIADN